MDTKTRSLALLAALFLLVENLAAQTYFHKDGPGWWVFGIDGGMAYQSSDVRATPNGWGGGLTLGKNLAYRPGGLLSFEMRGRLLLDQSFGAGHHRSAGILNNNALNGSRPGGPDYLADLDSTPDSSFVFANHRTTMFEGGLEGVVTLNRLRERTGVVVNLFGGIGLDWYNTKTDQLGANGQSYLDKYLTVNQLATRRDNLAALRSIRDGRFETLADGFAGGAGRVGVMPGLGIEVGFQVTPRFVIGLGHKATFSRTDLLDGQQWTNQNTVTPRNDVAHYTNLHLRWDLEPAKKREREPEITITEPDANPVETVASNLFVRADIKNVRSAADVTARLNGREIPFRFSNQKFGASLPLLPGRNEFNIRASNLVGDDSETLVIFYKNPHVPPPMPPMPPAPPTPTPPKRLKPEVQFTSPARSPFTTERSEVFVTASVKNVDSKRDLRFYVNGREEGFSFAEGFEASVRLRDGRNTLRLEADNGHGRASDEVEIILETRVLVEKPSVSIEVLTKRGDPCGKTVTAKIERVERKSDIEVFLNGRSTSDWSWDSRRGVVDCNFDLQPGRNKVRVRATNEGGWAEDEATVECLDKPEPPAPPQKPHVIISEPRNGQSFSVKKTRLTGRADEVADRSKISVTVNGQAVRDFDFDKTTGEVRADVELSAGENTLKISASNPAGSDEATVRVTYAGVKTPPAVEFLSPRNGSMTEREKTEVEARVSNVASSSGIEFLVNGSEGPRYSFSNGKLTATVSLREGENSITVRATNADGADEKTIKVTRKRAQAEPTAPVALPPSVAFTYPSKSGQTTMKTVETLKFSTKNVENAEQIKVTAGRGKTLTGLQFDPKTGTGSIEVKLSKGENKFQISATTDGGTASAETSLAYTKPPVEPAAEKVSVEITSITPPIENTATVYAKTTGIDSRDGISVTINGATFTGFVFDEKGGTVKAVVPLVRGMNKVAVRAQKGRETDEAEQSIRY